MIMNFFYNCMQWFVQMEIVFSTWAFILLKLEKKQAEIDDALFSFMSSWNLYFLNSPLLWLLACYMILL